MDLGKGTCVKASPRNLLNDTKQGGGLFNDHLPRGEGCFSMLDKEGDVNHQDPKLPGTCGNHRR